jgi:hypothetical protein
VTRLTPADVDAWLEAAQRHGLAPSTIHTTLSVVRRFCTFLQEQPFPLSLQAQCSRGQLHWPFVNLDATIPPDVNVLLFS